MQNGSKTRRCRSAKALHPSLRRVSWSFTGVRLSIELTPLEHRCRRRKQRCDGRLPCQLCAQRGLAETCRSVPTASSRALSSPRVIEQQRPTPPASANTEDAEAPEQGGVDRTSEPYFNAHSRLLASPNGRFMFLGDSANLFCLQLLRRLVSGRTPHSTFTEDPLRTSVVECLPNYDNGSWLEHCPSIPPVLTGDNVAYLVDQYVIGTEGILDMHETHESLLSAVQMCVSGMPMAHFPAPLCFLTLAIGAQVCPQDRDNLADDLFAYGRRLTVEHLMEEPSLPTVHAYNLITMYMLGACRRNGAFMQLGTSVRAAYALGLHVRASPGTFSPNDFARRERLWIATRTLDLFLSASLGRPPATIETRDTRAQADYSASLDLTALFERILTDIYARRVASARLVAAISAHHRTWSSRFGRDCAPAMSMGSRLSFKLLHLRIGYYWSIILLTRPFLIESVTVHAEQVKAGNRIRIVPCTDRDSSKTLVHACVDSAVKTVALLEPLIHSPDAPKRLPFVINAIFLSALVLGFGYYGDLFQVFRLCASITTAHSLLRRFSMFDAIAGRNASIISYLIEVCNAHQKMRNNDAMAVETNSISGLFGQIHDQDLNQKTATGNEEMSLDLAPPASTLPYTISTIPTPSGFPSLAIGSGTGQSLTQDNEPLASLGTMPFSGGNHTLDDITPLLSESNTFPFDDDLMSRTLWFESYDELGPIFEVG